MAGKETGASADEDQWLSAGESLALIERQQHEDYTAALPRLLNPPTDQPGG